MPINSTQLLSAYEAVRRISHEDGYLAERFRPIEDIFEDKKANPDAVIMVYGVYNAGKSTLINALLGNEAAATDDIPLTDKVSSYSWGQYSILDTPGVDAPIEHENVTKEQMLRSDAIVFVVDPVGTIEEAKTLSVLMDLQQAGKQVFLVFNEKKRISEDDFIKLKDQTRERMQQMAAERGLSDVIKSIPIVKINAKRSLQGQLHAQPKLVELSGHFAFEQQLRQFLRNISPDEIYSRLKNQLTTSISDHIAILESRSQSESVKNHDSLLRNINSEKYTLHQEMDSELLRQRKIIYETSKSHMQSSPGNCQAKIELLLKTSRETIATRLNSQVELFANEIRHELYEVKLTSFKINTKETPAITRNLQSDLTNLAIGAVAGSASPEDTTENQGLTKTILPLIIKELGETTIEKWAVTAAAHWVTYAGVIFSVVGAFCEIFSEDAETNQLRKQTEERQRVRERTLQQIEDFAQEISGNFDASMRRTLQDELDTIFSNVANQVSSLRSKLNDSEHKNSLQIEKLLAIQQIAANA